jgi:hypothetical protein
MGLSITLFVDKPSTSKQTNLINNFHQYHYPVLIDAVHANDVEYMQTNFGPQTRFFVVSEFITIYPVDEIVPMLVKPDFVINFDEDENITEKQWVCSYRYLETILLGINHPDDIVSEGKQLLSTYCCPALLYKTPEAQPPQQHEHYELRMKHIEDKDTMLIEVEKPYCDLPYTVVIHEYSKKGLKSFFTDLFISQSWGVSRKDYAFLEEAWKYFDMQEEYDLDKMLLEATQRCFPSEDRTPDPEPVVYRRPIESVLQTLQKRIQGEQRKENDFWNIHRLEKRKREDSLLR